MRMQHNLERLLLIFLILGLVGCGYALVGRASNIPEDVKSVYLAPFENETNRSQIDQILTQAIANELVTRRRFSLASTVAEADATLRGAVTQFRVTPVSFDRDGRADEYEITIVAEMRFQRTDSEEILWEASNYTFRENYEVDTDDTSFIDLEDFALEETSIRFAQTMVSSLLEGF